MTLFLPAETPARDENGNVLPGATWEFYGRGTRTASNIGSATSDSNGDFSTVMLDASKNYRAVLTDADGAVLYDIESAEADLFAAGVRTALNASNVVLPGAKWSFYTTGTSTLQPVYADYENDVSLGPVLTADASGRFPQAYLDNSITYRAVLSDSAGNQVGDPIDPVDETNMLLFLSPGALGTETTFTNNGVTWTLAEERVAGQYGNGDYWVVIPNDGNAQLTSATPASVTQSGTFDGGAAYTNETLHGLQSNPAQGTTGQATIEQGFHSFNVNSGPGAASTLQPYNASLNDDPGLGGTLTVTTPQTLVKTITDTTPPDNARDDILTDMSLLTFVSSAPGENAMRPSPRSSDKASYFTTSDIDTSFLPNVTAPGNMPTYATLLARVDKPYQTFFTNNLFCRNVNPSNQQEGYGRDIAHDLSEVLLALCTNGLTSSQKTTLMTHVCQLGLDLINGALDGATWGPINGSYGGGQHWVKAVSIVTAHALRNASNSAKATELLNRVDPDNFIWAAEDRMWTYVDRVQIETFPDQRTGFDHIDFKDYMENAPMWNSKPSAAGFAGSAFDHVYKTLVWASTIGQVLALRMMGLESYVKPAQLDFMDFYYDQSELETPGSAPNWIRAFVQSMIDDQRPTESANFADTAAPSVVRTMARDEYVWFELDKLISLGSIPPASDFTVKVNGSSVSISSQASDDFTDTTQPYDFTYRSPNCYGYSLAVRLASPVAEGDTVTLQYTPSGTSDAETLGGTAVPSIAEATATNQTGLLPDAIVSPITFRGRGVDDENTQYSGTNAMPPETIDWLQLSARFRIDSKSVDDTFISARATSSSLFWMYLSSTANMRLYFGRNSVNRVDFGTASLPADGTDLTMHLFIDYSQTDEANAVKVYFEWDGSSYEPTIASSARTADTPTLAQLFANGFFVGGPLDSTDENADMSHTGYILRFGQGSTPTAQIWSDAKFNWDADWGGNGENVWGEPDYYWAAETLDEANSSIPNRGNNGALAMTPRRIDLESEDIVPEYTEVV